METASIVVQGPYFQARISVLKLLANIFLDGMCKPNVYSEVFEIIIAADVVKDHQLVVPNKELI